MLALWYQPVLAVLFFVTCILLVLLVLLQKGRGGGLGAMFGGAGGSAFGARTGDVLTWVTIVLTGMFLLLAIGTTMAFRPPHTDVSAPKFSVTPPGKIGQTNNVLITTTTRKATIWYQIDDKEAGIYRDEKAIAVPVGSKLTAWATRDGWTTSKEVAEVYGVEPPIDDSSEGTDTTDGSDSSADALTTDSATDDGTDETTPDDGSDETVPDAGSDETVPDDGTDETVPDATPDSVTDAPE